MFGWVDKKKVILDNTINLSPTILANPWTPYHIGESGFTFEPRGSREIPKVLALGHNGATYFHQVAVSKWRYLGQYSLQKAGPLTGAEWASLSIEV